MKKQIKNPAAKTTRIEADVPYRSLPEAPKNYEWFKRIRTSHRKYKRRVKVKVRRYRYVFRKEKAVKIRYYKVKGKRRRRLITRFVRVRRRSYYTAFMPVVKVYRRKYISKWWALRPAPKVKGDWQDAEVFIQERLDAFGLGAVDVERDKTVPFDYIERKTTINFYAERLPVERYYDIIFINYVIRISTYEVGKRAYRYVLVCSSFDLAENYPFSQIIQKFVPMAIETTKRRIKKSRKQIEFVGYVYFSAVTKRELNEGRE